MKVLHVIASMDPVKGGVCQAVRTIVFGLNQLGIFNEVVSLDSPNANFLSEEDPVIHPLGTGSGIWAYSRNLLPWLKDNMGNFDVVIIHGLWQYHSYSVEKATRFLKKKLDITNDVSKSIPKVFVMPHGMLDPYFQRASGRKLKAIRNWFYWKLIEGSVISEANGILFTCEVEKRLARETFHPYRPKNEIVVGLGVKHPPTYTTTMRNAFLQKCPQVENDRYILFLSRIHPKKGVDILIKAYESLYISKSMEHELPKLVVAGPGIDTAYCKELLQLVNMTEGLRDRIYFPGMLQGEAKWGALYGCETFILPSHQENFGIAVVEALACQKTVLISNQVNIFQEIEDGGAGVALDDTIEGTLQLLKHWNNLSVEKKEFMSSQAKKTYHELFSIEKVSNNFLKILN